MSLPTPDAATEKEVRQLLQRLARLKKNWPQEPALRDLSPQMVDNLLKNVDIQNKTRAATPFAIAALTFCTNPLLLYGKFPYTFIAPLVCIVWGSAFWIELRKQRQFIIYALTQVEEKRVLTALIKATSEDWGMHPKVTRAITRLLPQVTEDDAGLLDRKAQERLWQLALASLNYGRKCNEALAHGALSAFTHIGSRDTLNRMRNFTLHMTFYPAHRRVYDALQQAIPLMEARLKRQEVPETLLRAAAMPAPVSDTLLRSAQAAPSEPSGQLLRAGLMATAEEDAS